MCARVTAGFAACLRKKNISPPFNNLSTIHVLFCAPFSSTILAGVHETKKNEKKVASPCPAFSIRDRGPTCESAGRNTSRDFSTVYEHLPIHPPEHGLPADCKIDRWWWLSRVSVGGPCALHSCSLLFM